MPSNIRSVPLLDLTRLTDTERKSYTDTFNKVLCSGRYIMGPEVEAFEQQCADYLNCKHSITVSSGTDALLVALMALGVGPDDEVICPSYTFFSTASSIARLGAKPVFVDCDLQSFNSKAYHFAKKLNSKTKAIIAVHLYGQTSDISEIISLANHHNIPIIEDVAQAFGATTPDHHQAGSKGAVGCFSFFPSKNLAGFGDGGLVSTQDPELAEKCRIIRNHGMNPKYVHHSIGGNFRMDALQAALLRIRMKTLDADIEKRRKNAAFYRDNIQSDAILLPEPAHEGKHTYNQFTLRVLNGQRARLIQHLKNHHIGCEIYYPVPLHLQPCFQHLQKVRLPHAEQLAEECLSIPIFPNLLQDELEYIAETINKFLS
ncbi:MAG: DegT/DnrJ/EryC1/StrS family aminotransferase [Verrucomicrobiota bacterium]